MEKIEAYKKYDFSNNQKWIEYEQMIFPVPPADRLEKIRRKWYKTNVDADFDPVFDAGSQQQNTNSNAEANQNNNSSQPSSSSAGASSQQSNKPSSEPQPSASSSSSTSNKSSTSSISSALYHIEGILKILFFTTFFVFPSFYIKIGMALVCVMAIYRNNGFMLSKDYAIRVIQTEFFGNLFYMVPVAVSSGFVMYLPIGIHFLSGVAEYLNQIQPSLYKKDDTIAQFFTFVKNNRNELILAKQKCEIYIFFYSLIGIFLGLSSIFTIILVFQYISLQSQFNQNMIRAQYEFQESINSVLNGPSCPSILKLVGGQILWAYEKLLSFQ